MFAPTSRIAGPSIVSVPIVLVTRVGDVSDTSPVLWIVSALCVTRFADSGTDGPVASPTTTVPPPMIPPSVALPTAAPLRDDDDA